ncbi:hypothetical protein [Streptomyces nodosus]|uniref:hypothetical protein n=1 Tax=Streptomyces nodosus TaxID=40318 RepID=UPI001A946F47|nr:hypothetical protein [Streptomyces nodosus]
MLPALGSGLALGRARGESMDALLFMLGGTVAAISFPLFFPRGRRKELNRRKAAGENVLDKEYEPPQWVNWTTAGGIVAWVVFSFILFRS